MPIYEYSCPKCEHQFEVLVRSDKDLPSKCPACGKGKPSKIFSSFAVSAPQSGGFDPASCPTCPSAGTGCGGSCGLGL